jgi:hypothetical protein
MKKLIVPIGIALAAMLWSGYALSRLVPLYAQGVEKPRFNTWQLGEFEGLSRFHVIRVQVVDTPGACFYVFITSEQPVVREVKRADLPAGKGCQ